MGIIQYITYCQYTGISGAYARRLVLVVWLLHQLAREAIRLSRDLTIGSAACTCVNKDSMCACRRDRMA